MNVGGAQSGSLVEHAVGPQGAKRGALYCSEHWSTALLESYGGVALDLASIKSRVKENQKIEVYKLQLKNRKQLKLIGYDRALAALTAQFPVLSSYLALTNAMTGKWPDLKKPAPCQLIAHWLFDNAKSADGLKYQSTIDLTGHCACLFFVDDDQAKKLFAKAIYSFP